VSKYLLAFLAAIAAAPLRAQEAVPPAPGEPARLTLTGAAARALVRYPSVAAAAAAEEEARAAAGEAGAARLPTATAVGSAFLYQKDMVVTPIHGFGEGLTPPFDDLLFQGALNLSYLLFDGGARRGRIRGAEAQAEATRAARDAVSQAVVDRVVSTYVEILGQQEVLSAHDRRIVSLRAERERVQKLLEVGRAAEIDRLRIDAGLAGAEADRTRVAVALDRAERDLAALVGGKVDETRAGRLVPLGAPSAPPPPREALVEPALRTSPVVEEARRRLAAAEAAVGVARSARWPEARLAGNYLAFGGGSTPFESEWNAGVQVSVPLFDGGATSKAIARKQAARQAARERLRQAELDVASEIDRALAAFQEARARALSLAAAAARLAEVVRIQKLLLETGQGTETDYLDAEADLLEARANLTHARLGEADARAGLARAAGQLTPQWIEENLEKRS
jgi:outer membrane protein